MNTRRGVGLLLAAVLWSGPTLADQDPDLDLIPAGPEPVAQTQDSNTRTQNIYLEDALTKVSQQDDLVVPLPPPASYDWQDRLLLDSRRDWQARPDLRFVLSDRFNLRKEDDLPFPNHEDIVADFREAYLSWQPTERSYLDFGRINLKSGIALGYNPTDYFKTRAVSEPLSADPTVLREDRLGTLMIRLQQLWEGGSFTAAYAPAIHKQSAIYTNVDLPSLNPMFDRTNADDRFLVKTSVDLSDNFSPELLVYHEDGQTRFGTNLSADLGQKVVTYLEWSGGRRADLISDALNYGKATGTLPAASPSVLPTSSDQTFKSELALGASYTNTLNMTFNLEYHLNQAGFSSTDWDDWFNLGQGQPAGSPVANELWYIREYAQDQQQQINQQSLFARVDWVDAFGMKLELTGFANVDLHDGSGLIQMAASYYVSDAWTIGGVLDSNYGSRRSDFGSLGSSYTVLLSVVRYF